MLVNRITVSALKIKSNSINYIRNKRIINNPTTKETKNILQEAIGNPIKNLDIPPIEYFERMNYLKNII